MATSCAVYSARKDQDNYCKIFITIFPFVVHYSTRRLTDFHHLIFKFCASLAVTTVSTRAALRSAARGDLVVPRTRRRLGNRAFCVAGPTKMPSDIRTASSVTTFKNLLKTHLFIQSYYTTYFRVSDAVRRPCSDFMDMLRRLINYRIIIIIIIK